MVRAALMTRARAREGMAERVILFIKKRELLFLFLAFMLVYNVNFRLIDSGDSYPAALIPFNLLEYHNLILDHFIPYYDSIGFPTYFLSQVNGLHVSSYPIVMPVLITPLYVIPYIFLKLMGSHIDLFRPGFLFLVMAMEKLSASLIAASSGIFVYLSLRGLSGKKIALLCTFAYAFATNTWVISSQALWQHGMTELLLALIVYLVIINERKHAARNLALMGAMSGLLIFNRPADGLLVLPGIVYMIHLKNIRMFFAYALSALAAALPFLAYNLYYFDNFFGGYGSFFSRFDFNIVFLGNYAGTMISPSRGLFIYTPIMIFALAGIFFIKKVPNRGLRAFLYASAVAVFLESIVYASFSVWWAGYSYGPRFLTGSLPLLILFIALSLPEGIETNRLNGKERMVFAFFIILLGISFLVQAIGAFYYNYLWDAFPVSVDLSPGRLWDLHDTQIMRSLNNGPAQKKLLDTFQSLITWWAPKWTFIRH